MADTPPPVGRARVSVPYPGGADQAEPITTTGSPAKVTKTETQKVGAKDNDGAAAVQKDAKSVTAPLNFKAAVTNDPSDIAEHETWIKRLSKIACRPWKNQLDNNLRPMVPAEKEVLAAWVKGTLVLDMPPAFLVYTHTQAQRVAYWHFFEKHLQGQLVASVPSIVRMPANVTERMLLAQLVVSEKEGAAGHAQTCKLIRQVKRVDYNGGTRRVSFVVADKAAAAGWHGKTILYKGARLLLLSPAKLD